MPALIESSQCCICVGKYSTLTLSRSFVIHFSSPSREVKKVKNWNYFLIKISSFESLKILKSWPKGIAFEEKPSLKRSIQPVSHLFEAFIPRPHLVCKLPKSAENPVLAEELLESADHQYLWASLWKRCQQSKNARRIWTILSSKSTSTATLRRSTLRSLFAQCLDYFCSLSIWSAGAAHSIEDTGTTDSQEIAG